MNEIKINELPKQLQPLYAKLLQAETKEEIGEAVVNLLREEENVAQEDKEKLLEMRMKTPMGRHRRRTD